MVILGADLEVDRPTAVDPDPDLVLSAEGVPFEGDREMVITFDEEEES